MIFSTNQSRGRLAKIRFSQSSLQDYEDCPRLFQLRHIQQIAWPAPVVTPNTENEHYTQRGNAFHMMVQQYFLNVPPDSLGKLAKRDPLLFQWWHDFIDYKPDFIGYTQYPEITLSTTIGDHRLVAKYDFIGVHTSPSLIFQEDTLGTKVVIMDWKTSRKLPKREGLSRKLQTRVYPYVVARAGTSLTNGNPIIAEQIEMVYWFSNFPTAPIKIAYNQEQLETDENYIMGLIQNINALGSEEAPMTDNKKRCRFCAYRSLCDRGDIAGSFDELEDDWLAVDSIEDLDLDLDYNQTLEIEL